MRRHGRRGRGPACYNELDKYVTDARARPREGSVHDPADPEALVLRLQQHRASNAAVSPDSDYAGPLVNVVDYQFAA